MGAHPRSPRADHSRRLGRAGEQAAAGFLERLGYRVIGSGFLARRGEVDLVCRHAERLVLVEVKTRSAAGYGLPAEAVGPRKRRAMRAAAAEYRALAGWQGPIEFAVVSVQGDEIELIEDPFS